jgi:hypothetical protein
MDAMRGDLGLAREKCALAESLAESRFTQVNELKVGAWLAWATSYCRCCACQGPARQQVICSPAAPDACWPPQGQIEQLQASLTDAERRVFESELIRRQLHNTIQELKGNIRVFCRVRPPQCEGDSSSLAVNFPNTGAVPAVLQLASSRPPGSTSGCAPIRGRHPTPAPLPGPLQAT